MSNEFSHGGLDAHWTAALAETTGMPRPPFSPTMRVTGSLVFTSGQTYPIVGEPDPRPAAEGSLADHTSACLVNLDRIVAAAGGQRDDIVSVTIYNTRMTDQNIVNAVHAEFFGDHRPMRTHVEVSRLADPPC